MKNAVVLIFFVLVLVYPVLCCAAGEDKEEIRIAASLGELYGELTLPETESPVPLVILSHGFGGNLGGNREYADYFVN